MMLGLTGACPEHPAPARVAPATMIRWEASARTGRPRNVRVTRQKDHIVQQTGTNLAALIAAFRLFACGSSSSSSVAAESDLQPATDPVTTCCPSR